MTPTFADIKFFDCNGSLLKSSTINISATVPNDIVSVANWFKTSCLYKRICFKRFRFKRNTNERKYIDNGWVFIDGVVKTFEEIAVQNDLDGQYEITLNIMKLHGWSKIIEFNSGIVLPFMPNDILLSKES